MLATIVLFEPQTGRPLACLDGRLTHRMRTAAVSAAVTRYLAPADPSVLALTAAGCRRVRSRGAAPRVPLREVRGWSPTPQHVSAAATGPGLGL